jgi:hypothetical protein
LTAARHAAGAACLLLAATAALAQAPVDAVVLVTDGDRPSGVQAMAASAAYPGLGQLLNGAEAKAAVVGAVEAFLVARLVLEDRRTRHAFRRYQETGDGRYFDDYSDHFDTRQTLVWWVIGAALYGLADAYVDAHLASFEDPLPGHLEVIGGVDGGTERGVRVGVAIRF